MMDLQWLESLTPEERAELLTEVEGSTRKDECEKQFAEFVKDAWDTLEPTTPLLWNWHLDTLCGYMEAVDTGKIRRLIINIPPGTMKSLIVSVFYPAWQWTTQPGIKYLCGSNGDTLAERDAMKMRMLVESDWYQENWGAEVVLSKQVAGKKLFANEALGHRQSQGVTGKVTGKRADCIIWDDAHDAAKSESDIQRNEVIDAWDSAWSSRVNSYTESPYIIIMQRVHFKDITGHLLEKESQGWVNLAIPMRYDSEVTFDAGKDIGRPELNDPRSEEGELLFPDRFPEQAVCDLELDMGPYRSAGQMQQRPSPKSGGELMREWLMFFDQKPKGGNRYIIVDPAGERKPGVKGKRDNTAMGVIEYCEDGNFYLIDGYRDRLNLEERVEILFKWHRKYKPLGVGYERYSMQTDLIHIKSCMEHEGYRFKITELKGSLSKNDRIRRLIPLLSNGKIWLPESIHRVKMDGKSSDVIHDFIEKEYVPFPVGEFDDFLDMFSRICDPDMKMVMPKMKRRTRVRRHRIKNRNVGY